MSDDLDKRLSVHEAICAQRYEQIEKRLGDGSREVPMPEALRSQYQAFTCADMSKTNSILDEKLGKK